MSRMTKFGLPLKGEGVTALLPVFTTWHGFLQGIVNDFYRRNLYCRIYKEANKTGLNLILIGDHRSSRLAALHEREPGVLYLCRDDGKEVAVSKPVELVQAIWWGELMRRTDLIRQILELDQHDNLRLLRQAMSSQWVTFVPV